MRIILPQKFFNRPTLKVAKELLGKFLVRRMRKKIISGMITEVETYAGLNDRASHASRGKTERTKIMFGKPGHWYIYLIYGMHYCLNIVTEREGYPAAILIRSVLTPQKHSNILKNVGMFFGGRKNRSVNYESRTSIVVGPGRVCKYFKIDKRFNSLQANKKTGLWIEDRGVRVGRVKRGKRIGVDYAGEWKDKFWRFYV